MLTNDHFGVSSQGAEAMNALPFFADIARVLAFYGFAALLVAAVLGAPAPWIPRSKTNLV